MGPMARRYRILPDEGTLLVSTDLHGDLEAFEQLRAIFEARHAADPSTHWAILGDLVHGPDPTARQTRPDLYDYDDESWTVVESVAQLVGDHPDRVHLILGNHDWAHVGGPVTRKFHPDEAAHLEERLEPDQIRALRRLFDDALLCLVAPCGLVLSHGAPDVELASLEQLDRLLYTTADADERGILSSFLLSYGQPATVCERFLDRMAELSELELSVVVHGHDRDEAGWFVEGDNQVCPVIFGAPRPERRFLELDLARRYRSAGDLREGHEIQRLFDFELDDDGT